MVQRGKDAFLNLSYLCTSTLRCLEAEGNGGSASS